jgi:hypothetical protein
MSLARARSADRVSQESGLDLGDELRRRAFGLAHRSAWEHVLELRRIEAELLHASRKGQVFANEVDDMALEVIRTHMARGLARAQRETGDRATYWVPLR